MTRPLSSPKPSRRAAKSPVPAARTGPLASLTKAALVHELQVHQVELEQQNEELQRAHHDLVAVRDRFIDLFDFAPVSYLTLDRDGRIIEANLTAAAEFATLRQSMLGSPFAQYVAPGDGDRWQRLVATAFRRGDLRRIELVLVRQDGRPFHAQLDCQRVMRAGSRAQLRVTLTDVSERHRAERNHRIAASGSTARESERRALARRLHEDLGQRLAALKLHLHALAPPADAASARAAIDTMAAEIDQALAVVRQISTGLHPLMLDHLGLEAALEGLTRDVASRLGLTVELHLDDAQASMDESLAIAFYRLVETALEHFALHVDAGISIELLRRPSDWVLVFQSVPGHARVDAPQRPMMALPEAFSDQVHLMGARLELGELQGGILRVMVFAAARPADAPVLPRADPAG